VSIAERLGTEAKAGDAVRDKNHMPGT